VNYQAWQFWLNTAAFILAGMSGAYTWWSNRSKATDKKFAEHDDELEKIRTRMTKVEASGGCSQHAELDVRVRKVEIVVGRIDGRMEGVGNALDNIQNFLMEKGPR